MLRFYPKLWTDALSVIVTFASTYLCKSGFSTLMHIKSRTCKKLNMENEIGLAITKTRISKLAFGMQQQKPRKCVNF